MFTKRLYNGFTLVEVLIVAIIISIFAAFTLFNANTAKESSESQAIFSRIADTISLAYLHVSLLDVKTPDDTLLLLELSPVDETTKIVCGFVDVTSGSSKLLTPKFTLDVRVKDIVDALVHHNRLIDLHPNDTSITFSKKHGLLLDLSIPNDTLLKLQQSNSNSVCEYISITESEEIIDGHTEKVKKVSFGKNF